MAYDKKELFEKKSNTKNNSIYEISLLNACNIFTNKFKSEDEFTENLLPKLNAIIKNAYDLDIENIELEKSFKLFDNGYYNILADIYITTKQKKDILIECKNPKHNKTETFNAFAQLMSYEYLLSKTPFKPKLILAISNFDFYFFNFMNHYKLKYDLILNNKDKTAYWINDLNHGI